MLQHISPIQETITTVMKSSISLIFKDKMESDDVLKNHNIIKVSTMAWSEREDEQLIGFVNTMPTQCRISWTTFSALIKNRSAKQCRDRWCKLHQSAKLNYIVVSSLQ